MVQVLPQVQVFQEFTLIPTPVVLPLRAFIFGPHFNVRSYEKAKSQIGLGDYAPAVDTAYDWPERQAGEIVDQAFTRVFIDNARIKFYEHAGGGSLVATVAPNILRIANDGWKAVTDHSRYSAIPLDVSIGDEVVIDGTTTAKVRGFVQEPVVSTHDANATVAASNKATSVSGSAAVTAISTVDANLSAAFTLTAFKPYKVGVTSVTYTFEVVEAGLLGAAKVNVTSDSGLDDAFNVTLAASAAPTSFGALGAVITITDAGTTTLQVGDTWAYTLTAGYTATLGTDFTVGGTYTGTTTTNYVITVTQGGVIDTDTVLVTVRTAEGTDAGGPYALTSTGQSIGSKGLTLLATAAKKLCKGDVFSFAVTAATVGRVRDLVLDRTVGADADVQVTVSAIRNQEILATRYNQYGIANWTQAATAITIKSGILSYAPAEPSLNGYAIIGGTLYAGYRALSQTYASEIQTVTDVASLSALFSDLTPENPLAYGLKKALENANGTDVKFIGVATNDLTGYSAAVGKTLEREDVYSFVPLTKDAAVLSMVVGHVKQQSTPEKGRWRIAWVTDATPTEKRISGSDETPLLATLAAGSGDPGGTYRLVTCSTATFVTDGVAAGDTFRYSFSLDAIGNTVYVSDVVDSVISETQLKIVAGPAIASVVAEKIEIWRALSLDTQITDLSTANSYGTRRAYNVIGGNQNLADGFTAVDDIFLAAAFAGLRSGVAPHQGLTNVQVSGFTGIPWTSKTLTATQRDALMSAGFWVVEQNLAGAGEVYSRKEISTDLTDLNTSEQMVTTNVDSISYYLKTTLAPYIGRTNNVGTVQNLIRGDIEASFQFFINNKTPTLGSQVLEGTEILDLRTHAVLKDRLVIKIQLVIPYALNNIDVYLVV
jgi:hypothetical protein